MKKFKRMIACLVLMLGLSGAALASNAMPASANVGDCAHYSWSPTFSWGRAICYTGGVYNHMHVLVKCTDNRWYQGNNVYLPNQYSVVYCPSGYTWTELHAIMV